MKNNKGKGWHSSSDEDKKKHDKQSQSDSDYDEALESKNDEKDVRDFCSAIESTNITSSLQPKRKLSFNTRFDHGNTDSRNIKRKKSFQGIKLMFAGFTAYEKEELRQLIHPVGAIESCSNFDYLVCQVSLESTKNEEIYLLMKDNDIFKCFLVTEAWLRDSITKNQLMDVDQHIWYQPPQPMISLSFPFIDNFSNDYVKLPCSEKNCFDSTTIPKWPYISSILKNPITDFKDLQNTFQLLHGKKIMNLFSLHSYIRQLNESQSQYFFHVMLPHIIEMALALPNLCDKPLLLLKRNESKKNILNQKQIASLLANAFFGLYPERKNDDYPSINFTTLYIKSKYESNKCRIQKIQCLCHYFDRIYSICFESWNPTMYPKISFTRISLSNNELKEIKKQNYSLVNVHVMKKGRIEDVLNSLQVDFANRYLGGGILGNGCVQEEIRFLISPELICGCLFCAVMEDNESILIKGIERFSNYSGYGQSFCWIGNYNDKVTMDSKGFRNTSVVAIDATPYSFTIPSSILRNQYHPKAIERELNKALVGYVASISMEKLEEKNEMILNLSTGNWGCGAFGGNVELKFLIQWLAASIAQRSMYYFTFQEDQLQEKIQTIVNKSLHINTNTLQQFLFVFLDQQKQLNSSIHVFQAYKIFLKQFE